MILGLLRVKQYYKNLLVFLAMIFTGMFFDMGAILSCVLGFFALSFVSSLNYVLNDFVNLDEDRKHKDKASRPMAAGKISVYTGLFIGFVVGAVGLVIGILLSVEFFYLLLLLFVLTTLYTMYFRNEVFLDVLFISFNFVIRAVAGAMILDVIISPWLILCTFFLSLFLAVGKRRAELFRGVKRSVLKLYDENVVNAMMVVTSALLLVSYSMYSFLSVYPYLIYSIPFAFYVILRYLYLVYSGSVIALKTELAYRDWRLVLGSLVWVFVVSGIVYVSL
jgi:4-hydroxybenzoate polyprenyltransferase